MIKVFDNVKVYDPAGDDKKNTVYHVEIENGFFSAIKEGRFEGEADEVIDGLKRVLRPSFTDSHLHLLSLRVDEKELDLRKVESWEEVKQSISDDRVKRELNQEECIVERDGSAIN